MDLPVKFPSETEVILDDVARFRALSPEERIRSYRSFLKAGAMIARRSPKAAWASAVRGRTRDARPEKHPGVLWLVMAIEQRPW